MPAISRLIFTPCNELKAKSHDVARAEQCAHYLDEKEILKMSWHLPTFRRSASSRVSHKPIRTRDEAKPETVKTAQQLNRSSSILAGSVLLDSAVEHNRGSFHNPAMVTPIATSLVALLAALHGLNDEKNEKHRTLD